MQRAILAAAVTVLLLLTVLTSASGHAAAQTPRGDALTGVVSSTDESHMEGVVLSARRDTANYSVSVVSDAQGRYRFPRTHVEPGTYTLSIRAVGYQLAQPERITVGLEPPLEFNLKLRKLADISAQLTNLEWVMSVPGTPEEKRILVRNAVNWNFCHPLERVMRSRYTAEQWEPIIRRMLSYHPDHTGMLRHQKMLGVGAVGEVGSVLAMWWDAPVKDLARYLATINLNASKTWSYPLKTLPRPTGRATRVITTVYDLPRKDSVVHDLAVDSQGNVWYGDTGWDYIGKLDPKSSRFTEFPSPNYLPAPPVLLGVMDVQVDTRDNLWAAVPGPKLAMFDVKQQKWTAFEMPGNVGAAYFLAPFRTHTSTHWALGGRTAYRLHIPTGKVDAIPLVTKERLAVAT